VYQIRKVREAGRISCGERQETEKRGGESGKREKRKEEGGSERGRREAEGEET
jgi:hypothetical protein